MTDQLELDATPIYLRNMNPEQLEAILHGEGPLRMMAKAGSGKTRVVVHRIARLVTEGADPARILAVTFSKKAADEMNERLKELRVFDARVGTWHSLCYQIVREDKLPAAEREVDTKNRAKFVLKDVVGHKNMNWKTCDLTKLSRFIGHAKAMMIEPSSPEAPSLARKIGVDARLAVRAFHLYDEMLEERGILTYDDFLVFARRHLETEPARATWTARWDYVIQDEAQDESPIQGRIATLLARDHRNYMVVGDPAQAIYSFRASSPLRLLDFHKEWVDTKTVCVNRNYRSGRKIIEAANRVISKAPPEFAVGEMIAERGTEGSVRVVRGDDLEDEGANLTAWIRELRERGAALSDVFVLFRLNAQSRALEEALLKAKLPYVVIGGTSFYERKEVRDLLAYLRVASGRGELEDVKRCINAPFRFLGARYVERLMDAAAAQPDDRGDGGSGLRGGGHTMGWPALVEDVAEGERIQARQKASAFGWAEIVRELAERITRGDEALAERSEGAEADPMQMSGGEILSADYAVREAAPASLLADVVRKTAYIEWLEKEEGEESIESSHVANVRELIRVAERFATAWDLLDYVADTIRAAEKQRRGGTGDRVQLMSIHRSKGLEAPYVFVSGFCENVFPHYAAIKAGDLEEERRLAYVAMTRARDELVLSHVKKFARKEGVRPAEPSRYLFDAGVLSPEPGDEEEESPGQAC